MRNACVGFECAMLSALRAQSLFVCLAHIKGDANDIMTMTEINRLMLTAIRYTRFKT